MIQQHIDADVQDIKNVLKTIEKSYGIRFENNELSHIRTFGELCGHIISKLHLKDTEDYTTQQAFYRLKEAIVKTNPIDRSAIHTNTTLSSIFKRHCRRRQMRLIEDNLGFKLHALRPRYFIMWLPILLSVGFLITLFFHWQFGIAGIICSIILFKLTEKRGSEFKEETVGELVERITEENYLKLRRDPQTINKKEVIKKIERLFIRVLGLDDEFDEIPANTIIFERDCVD